MSDDTLGDLGYSESLNLWGEDSKPDEMGNGGARRFLGKYRGTVLNNVDPMKKGRLLVQVVDVLGIFMSSWAMPCVPVGGFQMGAYLVPPVGAGVWVEFEQGNPDKPIWVGSFWGSAAELPATALTTMPGTPVILLQTMLPAPPLQAAVVVCDVPVPPMRGPGVMLRSGPSMITVDPVGVQIIAPTIEINGVTIVNKGALTVT